MTFNRSKNKSVFIYTIQCVTLFSFSSKMISVSPCNLKLHSHVKNKFFKALKYYHLLYRLLLILKFPL